LSSVLPVGSRSHICLGYAQWAAGVTFAWDAPSGLQESYFPLIRPMGAKTHSFRLILIAWHECSGHVTELQKRQFSPDNRRTAFVSWLIPFPVQICIRIAFCQHMAISCETTRVFQLPSCASLDCRGFRTWPSLKDKGIVCIASVH
jgi:hypothetical protein